MFSFFFMTPCLKDNLKSTWNLKCYLKNILFSACKKLQQITSLVMWNQACPAIDGFPSTLADLFLSGVCAWVFLFAREHVNLTKRWRRPAGSQRNSRMRLCSQLFHLRLFGDPDLCTLPWRHLPSIFLSFLFLSASLSVCLHFFVLTVSFFCISPRRGMFC